MNTLLLEIGSEEIPAGYIQPALDALSSNLLQKLADARLEHGEAKVYATPRRLAIMVEGVDDKQTSITEDLVGPPESVGFDNKGKPTVAAEKFAEKAGVLVSTLKVKETEKGRYLFVQTTHKGMDAGTVLAKLLPEVIKAIPFPKTMRWADLSLVYTRPIHWIMAFYGNQLVDFSMENIQTGKYTFGHRFMSSGKITIENPDEYLEKLRNAYVWPDISERKESVEKLISQQAAGCGGKVLHDPELVDTVVNLIEYPAPVTGTFENKYLKLPSQILITAMREHQKYFAIIDHDEKLMPHFIAVNNTVAKDMGLVATGHERVLRARLSDAEFFYESDLKISAENRVEKLKGVLFQAKLGSMYEKMERITELAGYLAELTQENPELTIWAQKAARLCKSDLVSHVVGEFPKLQGVMGKVYATVDNEPAEVALAIEEHYRPTFSGGALPETTTGAIVAIADKIDSICGCFSVGLLPTGAADPYALRRQGIGITNIMLDKGFSFSFKQLIDRATGLFAHKATEDIVQTSEKVYVFIKNRISRMLEEEQISKDVVGAIVDVSIDHVPNIWKRAKALDSLKAQPDFEPLAVAFKRVVNIIKKAPATGNSAVNDSLFEHSSETTLFQEFIKVEQKVNTELQQGAFDSALHHMATLRDSVDNFFDDVLVMAEDMTVRNNRLALLKRIAGLFEKIADFSKISAS
ncbi:MAG: glycine--tRNA ligase subunit beta [Desulfobacterales bacterium]